MAENEERVEGFGGEVGEQSEIESASNTESSAAESESDSSESSDSHADIQMDVALAAHEVSVGHGEVEEPVAVRPQRLISDQHLEELWRTIVLQYPRWVRMRMLMRAMGLPRPYYADDDDYED